MSLLSTLRSAFDPKNLVRVMVDPAFTQRPLCTNVTTVNTPGIYHYYLAYPRRPGFKVLDFHVVSSTLLTADGSNYYIFRPFWSLEVRGASQIKYLGSSRSTASKTLTPDVPFRMHEEREVALSIPEDALLGVEVEVVGSPGSRRMGLFSSLVLE